MRFLFFGNMQMQSIEFIIRKRKANFMQLGNKCKGACIAMMVMTKMEIEGLFKDPTVFACYWNKNAATCEGKPNKVGPPWLCLPIPNHNCGLELNVTFLENNFLDSPT